MTTAKPRAKPPRIAYSVDEAAEAVGKSRDTITREIKAGRLEAKRFGRFYSIPAAALADWHSQLPDA